MCGHHRPESIDLGVQRGNDGDLADDDSCVGGVQHRRLPQLLVSQHLAQLLGTLLDVAAAGTSHGRGDRLDAQPGGPVGVGCLTLQLDRSGRAFARRQWLTTLSGSTSSA